MFSGMPKERRMLRMKRAGALLLTAFLLLSVLPVSTMASDKAAASGSSEAAYFDRLLETAPIDEAASDTGAGTEVETVQEYEKGAGDGTGALFGCETGTGDETDAIYGSEAGTGDETGALFGYGDTAETDVMIEERDGQADMPGDSIPADEAYEEEPGAEDAANEETDMDQPDAEDADSSEINAGQPDAEDTDGETVIEEETDAENADAEDTDGETAIEEETDAENADAEDADGETAIEEEPDAENADADGTDADGIDDPALNTDENAAEDASAAETGPGDYVQTDAGDEGMSSAPAAGEESPGQMPPEDNTSPEAAGESYEYEAVTEDAADSGTYTEEAAAAREAGESADPLPESPEGLPQALSDQTQTGADSVDERAALTAMSLSLTDQIVMNIYVRADDSVESDDYIEFSYAGETLQQSVGEADVNRMTLADGETFDVLTFALPLRMRQMTDDVTFRMVVDGEEGTPKTRTVRSYADQILRGHFSDEQKEVTRAMLNCGSCAQEYFGYNMDRPANAGIYGPGEDPVRDWEDPDLSSYDYSLYQDSQLGFEFCETTLELQEDISLICYFRVGEAHFFDNFTNLIYDFSLKGSDLDLTPGYDRDKGMFYVRIPHIMPYELDETFEIEVTNRIWPFTKIVASLKYSPLTYCRDMLASDSSSPEIKNLCRSLYYYCNAANIMRNEDSSSEDSFSMEK